MLFIYYYIVLQTVLYKIIKYEYDNLSDKLCFIMKQFQPFSLG